MKIAGYFQDSRLEADTPGPGGVVDVSEDGDSASPERSANALDGRFHGVRALGCPERHEQPGV